MNIQMENNESSSEAGNISSDEFGNGSSMSNYPIEYRDGKHCVVDPDEEHEKLPDISHLESILNEEQFARLKAILKEHACIFSKNKNDIGCTHLVEHEIELEPNTTAHREGLRRLSPEKLLLVSKTFQPTYRVEGPGHMDILRRCVQGLLDICKQSNIEES